MQVSGVGPGKKEMLYDSTHVVKRSRWPKGGGLLDYRLSVGIYELLLQLPLALEVDLLNLFSQVLHA